MAIQNHERDAALAELQEQGLTVRLYSAEKNTWHIAAGGLYSGYVVSGDVDQAQKGDRLNIRGIRSLV